MKTDQYIHNLYQKFLSNRITEKELQELFDCLDSEQEREELRLLIRQTITTETVDEQDQQVNALVMDVKNKLREKLQPKRKEKTYWKFYTAVAAAIALMAIGVSYYLHKERLQSYFKPDQDRIALQDILPGSNQAILTLSNGKKVQLDDQSTATYTESGIEIKQEKDGSIVYQITENTKGSSTGINTIEVPKGGQYKVVLPDGTKVWLNSVSTLSYPAAFGKASRTMHMTGEAYFDIAPNKDFPFKVITGQQEVTALGTSFNINAYANESAITTTLTEGKLKVQDIKYHKAIIIYPGQQTVSHSGEMKVRTANTADVMAWKEGLFVINKSNLAAVMRQVERWYDIEVDVKVPDDAGTFSGELPRNIKLIELLPALETVTGMKLKLEGRRITNR